MYNPPPSPPGYGYQGAPVMPGGAQLNPLPGAEPGSKTQLGIEGNVAGALAYIGPFNIVFAIIEKDNRFVRFNAFQSLLIGLTLLVIDVVCIILGAALSILAAMAGSGQLAAIFWMLFVFVMVGLSFAAIGGIIMSAIKAYQRQMFKVPFIGNMAESIVRKLSQP